MAETTVPEVGARVSLEGIVLRINNYIADTKAVLVLNDKQTIEVSIDSLTIIPPQIEPP